MEMEVKNFANKEVEKIVLPESIFNQEIRKDIMARVIRWQLSGKRSGTHSVKRIGDVSGTTRKPFKQKGTGNARQGSLRSPQMRGGATMHGPVFRSHSYSLPKKIRKMGLLSALSVKYKNNSILIIDDLPNIKTTKEVHHAMKLFGISSGLCIDDGVVDGGFRKASHNLHKVNSLPVMGVNVYDIIRHDMLILSKSAIEGLKKRLIG